MNDKIPPIHPGEHLQEDFLLPMGISSYELATNLSVPLSWVEELIQGKRPISAEMALRLGHYFGMESQFCLNLQTRYDLDVAFDLFSERLKTEVRPYSSRTLAHAI
jgi:addiction module HigA family antidote